jgi:hypothetical protein
VIAWTEELVIGEPEKHFWARRALVQDVDARKAAEASLQEAREQSKSSLTILSWYRISLFKLTTPDRSNQLFKVYRTVKKVSG